MELIHNFNTGFGSTFPMIAWYTILGIEVLTIGWYLKGLLPLPGLRKYLNYLCFNVFGGVPKEERVDFLVSPPELGSWMNEPLANTPAQDPLVPYYASGDSTFRGSIDYVPVSLRKYVAEYPQPPAGKLTECRERGYKHARSCTCPLHDPPPKLRGTEWI